VIDFKNATLGVEYEFGDIWRTTLPEGLSWNEKDYSIVSSTGIANDPKGKAYNRGGEINAAPTDTVVEQLAMFERLLSSHPEAALNYRTNLHLHIRVPGLSEDLTALKKLLAYVHVYESEIYAAIEPIPAPNRSDYESAEAYKGAQKRFKRRKVSHQQKVPKERVRKALKAKTVEEFLAAHAPVTAKGEPAWGLTTRAGINLLQLKETDTVEFRHFTNTLDVEQLTSCFYWVENFIPMALDNAPVTELLSRHTYQFPPFLPYNHAMEIGYQYTNFDKLSRKTVEGRLSAMRQDLNLEECRAEDVVAWISKNDPEHVF
jgi:hypothetical protein